MRLMVCGSRSWVDRWKVEDALWDLHPAEIIHGGAVGADTLAHEVAQELKIPTLIYYPDYKRPSPQRYHERNDRMLSECDFVLAFWDGKSTGTKSVIDKAERRGIPYRMIR